MTDSASILIGAIITCGLLALGGLLVGGLA